MKIFNTVRTGLLTVVAIAFANHGFAQATPAITGTWNVQVTLSQGSGNPVLTLKQTTDSTFTGTYKVTFGDAPLKGIIKGKNFSLQISANDLTMFYNGTLDGNSMQGKVKLGDYGEGDFTGQKKE